MVAQFNENSFSSKYQLNSTIQEISRKTKDRRSETSRGRESQRVRDRKNIE